MWLALKNRKIERYLKVLIYTFGNLSNGYEFHLSVMPMNESQTSRASELLPPC